MDRIVDRLRSEAPGPTLVLIGGVHGNEPAGVEASRRVLAELRRDQTPFIGDVVGVIGNVRALAAGRRYLVRDLNRQWTPSAVAESKKAIVAGVSDQAEPEQHETVELGAALDEIFARARGPVFVLDMHTTSSEGTPFGVVGPTDAHKAFASHFELPALVRLEEQLPGVLTRWLGERGVVTFAIEGGSHTSQASREHLAAAIRVGLCASGVVDQKHMPGLASANACLRRARGELPQMIEVLSRHAVLPEHQFKMEPGFATIQPTFAGTLIARDKSGEIRAPNDCLVLLPLYQAQGADGFFVGRACD
jgi:succinylglutamate desuccinylase